MTKKFKKWVYRAIRFAPVSGGTRMRWERRFMDWHWRRDMKAAAATKNSQHIERGHEEWHEQAAMLADEEQAYYSRKLLDRARALRVEVPPYTGEDGKRSEYFEESWLTGNWHLSLKGEKQVREAIRTEEKHRSEARARALPYIAALTGLVGTGTGLIVALEKLWK